ncbi:MAG: HD domain-containing protein [Pseudomonadales bacterium]|nr:HD domain-containing protein [Pseudomonadales bacterium]
MDDKPADFPPKNDTLEIIQLLGQYNIEICEDLHFLIQLALTVEQRFVNWQHRTLNSLRLALKMIECAQHEMDIKQLVAAILAHDFAMGFLPIETINKSGKYSARERKLMRTHINSAAELIHRMKQWSTAREMILSHHEHMDGSGYPNKLTSMEIPEGAKILAIIDTFTAQGEKRIMRGVMEINRHGEKLYCPEWLQYFNDAAKLIYQPA